MNSTSGLSNTESNYTYARAAVGIGIALLTILFFRYIRPCREQQVIMQNRQTPLSDENRQVTHVLVPTDNSDIPSTVLEATLSLKASDEDKAEETTILTILNAPAALSSESVVTVNDFQTSSQEEETKLLLPIQEHQLINDHFNIKEAAT